MLSINNIIYGIREEWGLNFNWHFQAQHQVSVFRLGQRQWDRGAKSQGAGSAGEGPERHPGMDSECQRTLRGDRSSGWDRLEARQELVSGHGCFGRISYRFFFTVLLFFKYYFRSAQIDCWPCYRCPPTVWPSRICLPTSVPGRSSWSSWARCIIPTYIPCWTWASCATAPITMPAWWRPSIRAAASRISSIKWVSN